MWEKLRVQLQKSNFIKMMVTLNTYKDDHWEESKDMPQPAHVLACWSCIPSHLELWWFFYIFFCVFPKMLQNGHSLLTLFTESSINVTVGPWHYGISMFHNFILFIENVLFFPELDINNSDFSSPLDCKTETKRICATNN